MQTRRSIPTLATITSLALAAAALPAAADPAGWDMVTSVELSETISDDGEWRAEKVFPDALRAAAEETFSVTGYYVPIVPEAYTTTFLIVPTPEDCPFCGGKGGFGTSLEVTTASPIADMPEGTELTVSGTLELMDDPHTFQSMRLTGARVTGPTS